MEIANSFQVRPAASNDRAAISYLLRQARWRHYHLDWFVPADWIGSPAFVVGEGDGELLACLAAVADPPPAAWVRVAAVERGQPAASLLAGLLEPVIRHLRAAGVTDLAWLATEEWPDTLLEPLGFREINGIETLAKDDLRLPPEFEDGRFSPVTIRPAKRDDLPALVALEAAAFDPLWRHSEEGLRRALPHTISFDVAELDGRIAGFQYSTTGHSGGAHLARLTVDPLAQRQGVGSALLSAAIRSYRRRRLGFVSLNTQADNMPSHHLYRKFDFYATGHRSPVWARSI